MTKYEALNMAWESEKKANPHTAYNSWCRGFEAALRQALAEPDMGIDRGAWSDVPDATKWVDELRGDEEPPTDSQIIAGAIFDFAGFLTTRDKVIKVGASANAAPVVDLVKEWADMRELSLDDAAVMWWSDVLEMPPCPNTDVEEPATEFECPRCGHCCQQVSEPKREWQGLTDEELNDLARWADEHGGTFHTGYGKAIEAALKSKNGF